MYNIHTDKSKFLRMKNMTIFEVTINHIVEYFAHAEA